MSFAHSLVVLGLLKETETSVINLSLIDRPHIAELVKNISFLVQNCNSALLCDILKSYDTIRDSATLKNSDPSDLTCLVAMGSTAGFGINSCNINNSERVTRNNTTLIKGISILLLSFSLIHEAHLNLVTFVD